MPDVANVTVGVDLNLAKATADLRAFTSKKYRFNLDNQFSGAIRGITGDVQSFDTSLTKATNRVVAFGAAAAVFKGAQAAFSAFAKATVDVEDSLAKINVNLNVSQEGLKKFSTDLFSVARQTGQSFDTAAKAAEEFARQGLGAEETIKRTRDALILTRIAAVDSAEAVNDLTAAVNTFEKEALSTTDILNKFVAVDTRFAVSSKDLADGLQRAGAVAADAGISLDKLIGMITAVKQSTGRDGSVIANGFKTIFERARAPGTIKQFEELGIATKDLAGNLLPVDQILKNLADTYDNLSQAQQQQISKSVANIQQINVFKALLTDLAKTYSITSQAAKVSADATDEALTKNLKLNQTLKAQIETTKNTVTQLFAALGNQDTSGIAKSILGGLEDIRKFLSGDSKGIFKDTGKSIGEGLLKGISNVITGPGLVILASALGKAFKRVITVIGGDIKSILSLNSIAGQRAEVQSRINDLLKQSTEAEYANVKAATTVLAQKRAILAIQERINSLSGASLLTSSFIRPAFGGGTRIEGLGKTSKVPSFAAPGGFLRGSYPIGEGGQARFLVNPKVPGIGFKQFKHGGDKLGIENEYLVSKLLESAGVPVSKVLGSLERSKSRGGIFKERAEGFEASQLPFAGQLEHAMRTQVISATQGKVDPVDLNDRGIIVKGKLEDYLGRDGLSKALANSTIVDPGAFDVDSSILGRAKRAFSGRRRPSFADPLSSAISREMSAGVPKHLIYVDKDPRLVSSDNPAGLLVANRRDEPVGGFQGVNRVLSQGGDPKRAGMMHVPHFADGPQYTRVGGTEYRALDRGNQKVSRAIVDQLNKMLEDQVKAVQDGTSSQKTLAAKIKKVAELLHPEDVQDFAARLKGAGAKVVGAAYQESPEEVRRPVSGRPYPRQRVPTAGDITPISINSVTGEPLGQFTQGTLRGGNTRGRAKAMVGSSDYDAPIGPPSLEQRVPEIRAQAIRADATRRRLTALVEERRSKQFAGARDEFLGSTPGIFQTRRGDVKRLGALGLDAGSEAGQSLLRDRNLQRIQRRGNVALGAAFIAPLAAGFIPDGQGGTTAGKALGATQGALQGAGIGGIAGPVGAGVGAAIGALVGYLGKANKSLEEFAGEIETSTAAQAQIVDAAQRFLVLGSNIKDLKEEGGDPKAIARLQQQRFETLQSVSDPRVRERLAVANDNQDEVKKILDEEFEKKRGLETAGAVTLQSKANAKESAFTTVGRAFQKPRDIIGGLIGDTPGRFLTGLATGGLSELIGGAGRGLEAGGQKTLEERVGEQKSLASTIFSTLNKDNVGKIDLKAINQGTGTSDDLAKLSEAFKALGAQVEVTTDQYEDQKAALSAAVSGFRRLTKIQDDIAKTAQPVGFTRGTLNSQANLGTISSAAFIGRSPGANRGQKAESRFDFFKELQSTGLVSEEGLETNADFKKARAETQRKRALEIGESFVKGNNPGAGNLRDSRGDLSSTAIQSALKALAGSGTSNSAFAKVLLPFIAKADVTTANAGVKTIPTRAGNMTPGGPDEQSGFMAGANYGSFTSSLKRGGAGYVTKENLQAVSKTGFSMDRFVSDMGGDRRFITKDTVNSLKPNEKRFDLHQAPTVAPSTAPQDYKDHAKTRDDDINAYLKIAKDAKDAAASAATSAQALGQQAIQINVTVNGLSNAIQNGNVASYLQTALQSMGMPIPKPLPPSNQAGIPVGTAQ